MLYVKVMGCPSWAWSRQGSICGEAVGQSKGSKEFMAFSGEVFYLDNATGTTLYYFIV
jgi:hypothetical protein